MDSGKAIILGDLNRLKEERRRAQVEKEVVLDNIGMLKDLQSALHKENNAALIESELRLRELGATSEREKELDQRSTQKMKDLRKQNIELKLQLMQVQAEKRKRGAEGLILKAASRERISSPVLMQRTHRASEIPHKSIFKLADDPEASRGFGKTARLPEGENPFAALRIENLRGDASNYTF